MKLKFERFDGLSCLYVREKLDTTQLKLFTVGLDVIVKDIQEPLLVDFTQAELTKVEAAVLAELKKRVEKMTQQKVIWLSKDRTFADYPNAELGVSRLTGGNKVKQAGERVALEDEIYYLKEQIRIKEAKLIEIGGDAANAKKAILENIMLKAQKKTLLECNKFLLIRAQNQTPVISKDPEIVNLTTQLVKDLQAGIGEMVEL